VTHMDDQVAKHIKEMIQTIRWENTEKPKGDFKPNTLNQIIRTLRRGPDRVYDLIPPRCYPPRDKGLGT
jgi:hypothetical protein